MQRVAATATVPAGGMSVPGYTLVRRIGVGGQAMVYEAVQNSLERRVALKVLNPLHSENAEFTRRFLNEGRILANLGHSNVITIHDIGVANTLHFLSMELVEGGDLSRRIRAGLDPRTVIDYLLIIADCLACAHERNVVHRDIKPANVLFRTDGILLLTDFGIAKLLNTEELTVAGTTMGSPSYLSPEQARNGPVDGRADIYSLGAMAFEMLTGHRPFSANSDFDTVQKHLTEPVPRLPADLERYQSVIDRMMAKSPSDRFASARALIEALRPLRAGVQVVALAGTPIEQQGLEDEEVDRDAITVVPLPGDEPGHAEPAIVHDGEEVTVVDRGLVPVGRARRLATALAVAGVLGVAATGLWNLVDDGTASTVSNTRSSTPRAAAAPAAPEATAPHAAASPESVAIPEAVAASPESVAIPEAAAASPESVTIPEAAAAPEAAASPQAADAVAVENGPTPDASPADAKVSALLAAGRAALGDLRLTRPEGDSALDYYARVLALEPDNAQALAGRRNIARRYASLAQGAIARGDRDRARALVMRGLAVRAGHSDLLALRDELEASPRDKAPADTPPPGTSLAGPSPPEPSPAELSQAEPSPDDKSPRDGPGSAAASGIQGETPRQLYQRVRSWFD